MIEKIQINIQSISHNSSDTGLTIYPKTTIDTNFLSIIYYNFIIIQQMETRTRYLLLDPLNQNSDYQLTNGYFIESSSLKRMKMQSPEHLYQGQNKRRGQKMIQQQSKSKPRFHFLKSQDIVLPKLQKSIKTMQQKLLTQIYSKKIPKSRHHYELCPMKKLNPIKLMTRPISQRINYLSLSRSKTKVTDLFFTQMQNIKLAERLLLMEPSKQVSKNQHEIFYQQQEKYRRNMQGNKQGNWGGGQKKRSKTKG